jgi:hypothetical protein
VAESITEEHNLWFIRGSHISNSVVVTGLCLLALFLRVPFYFRSVIDWDESTFILMGQHLLDGHLPYTDLWENKPPLAFAFFAATIALWKSIIAVRLAGTLCVVISAYSTWRVGCYIWGRQAGFFAAVLSIVFISLADSGQATMTEIIALVPATTALVVLVTRNGNHVACFLTGLLLAIATLIRLNLAYLAVVVGILIACSSHYNGRLLINRTVSYISGGLLPLGMVMLPYIIGGQAEIFINSVFITPLQYSGSLYSPTRALSVLVEKGINLSNVILWMGFVGGLAYIGMNWRDYDQQKKYGLLVIAIFSVGVGCSIVFSGNAHPHYLIQLVPFLSLISGSFFASVLCCPHKMVVTTILTLGLVIPAKPILSEYLRIGKSLMLGRPLLSDRGYQIARFLKSENLAGERLYMMTDHIVHWLTDTKPIAKSVTHPSTIGKESLLKALLGPHASTEKEIVAVLEKRPLYIVRQKEISYLSGEAEKTLDEELSNNYMLVKVIDGRYVYKRL